MTLHTRLVYGVAETADGQPIAKARIQAELTRYEIDDGIVVPSVVTAQADETGAFEIPLWPNGRGSGSSRYKVAISGMGTRVVSLEIVVPDGDGPVPLATIIDQKPYPPLDAAELAVRQAQDAAGQAVVDAGRAEAAAVLTEDDRRQTGEDRIATGEDRLAVRADAEQTAEDRIATGQDRTQTGLDRQQTGDDRAATAEDRIATGEDRVQTGLDAQATAADRIATGQDRVATGQDRVATGQDAQKTGEDAEATGLDRQAVENLAVTIGQQAQQVADDKLDVAQAKSAVESLAEDVDEAATTATTQAGIATTKAGEAKDYRDEAQAAASRVPDPAELPDNRILTVQGGALKYSPNLASVLAVTGATPARVAVYETGIRDVSVNTDAFGLKTDSGHTWVASPGSAGSPTLQYRPGGYLYAYHSPAGSFNIGEIGAAIIDDFELPDQYIITLHADFYNTNNHARQLILAQAPDGDRLGIFTSNYYFRVQISIGGVVTTLADIGNLGQGDVVNNRVMRIRARVAYAHTNFSPLNRLVDVYMNDVLMTRVPYIAGMEKFKEPFCRAGIGCGRNSYIFGFAIETGL